MQCSGRACLFSLCLPFDHYVLHNDVENSLKIVITSINNNIVIAATNNIVVITTKNNNVIITTTNVMATTKMQNCKFYNKP